MVDAQRAESLAEDSQGGERAAIGAVHRRQEYVRHRRITAPSEYAMTLDEVAAELGMTSGNVYMAEKSALRKARRILERRGYSEALVLDLLRSIVHGDDNSMVAPSAAGGSVDRPPESHARASSG